MDNTKRTPVAARPAPRAQANVSLIDRLNALRNVFWPAQADPAGWGRTVMLPQKPRAPLPKRRAPGAGNGT